MVRIASADGKDGCEAEILVPENDSRLTSPPPSGLEDRFCVVVQLQLEAFSGMAYLLTPQMPLLTTKH